MKIRSIAVAGVALLAVSMGLSSVPDGDAADALHLRLERSAPAADSVVSDLLEIRLWFSQSTQEDATSIRLLDAAGEPVPTGETQASDDQTVHHATLEEGLEAGRYTVAWRTMAQDGHVIRGDFEFMVSAGDDR